MGFKKNLNKLQAEPSEMRIGEVVNILMHFGFHQRTINGSHYQFKKEKYLKLTLAVHNNKVKKIYVKSIKEAIMPLLNIKNDEK